MIQVLIKQTNKKEGTTEAYTFIKSGPSDPNWKANALEGSPETEKKNIHL